MSNQAPMLPEPLFPEPLVLSPTEEEQFLSDADELIAETLLAFEDYIANDRQLDPEYWKFMLTDDGMKLFRTRWHNQHGLPPSGVLAGRDYFHEDSHIETFRPPNIPMVISTGCIPGTVEDAAFGSLADTPDRSRLRNSYILPDYEAKILATLQHPTEDDPFRFVVLKWAMRPMGPVIQARDLVFIESSGVAVDSNGERVHYFIMHSVDLGDRAPELKDLNFVRATGSVCFIYRTKDKKTVEVFCRSFTDPKSADMVSDLTSEDFAKTLVSPHTVVECAYVKKLMWLMLNKALAQPAEDLGLNVDNCAVCNKSFRDVYEVEKEQEETLGYLCQVCHRLCCSKCSVSKQIAEENSRDDDEDGGFSSYKTQRRSACCCIGCALEAKNLSAWDVAMSMLPISRS